MKPIAVAACVLALSALGSAQAPQRTHPIQPQDYFELANITACAISPDASRVAWTEMRWEPENDGRNTDLWVVSTDTQEVTRLTFDPAADTGPQWSPDGQWIYFTSSRKHEDDNRAPFNGKRQVWKIPAAGGEMVPVTRLATSVQAYELSQDGKALYYTVARQAQSDDPWTALREEHADLVYGQGLESRSELWRLDLSSWRSEKLADPGASIYEFAVSPDQEQIALITAPSDELITFEGRSEVLVLDTLYGRTLELPDALWREQAPSPNGWIVEAAWSGDSTALAFRVEWDGYPSEVYVARFDGGGPAVRQLARPGEVHVIGHMEWRPGSADLCFTAEDRARARVYNLAGAGSAGRGPATATVLTPGDVAVGAFSFAADGKRFAVQKNDATSTPDLFLAAAFGGPAGYQRLTRINPMVDTWKLPQLEVVKWTSTDGTPVEGILELPWGYEKGDGPLPTLVEIHGGPTASSLFAMRFWIYGRTLYAARGWAVLSPNYRGSTGYGDAFLTGLIGHKNDLDVKDILSGVDALVEAGIADPDRLAVMGWSNGGYLVNCLIAATQRFKAASSGAGVLDTVMQWSIEDTPGHVENFSEGLPWDRGSAMHRSSPLYSLQNVTTPTLIHAGENDPRVPVQHGRALFRALHHYLGVPAQLVEYPGAGHSPTTYKQRKAKMDWDLRWLGHYVLGEEHGGAVR